MFGRDDTTIGSAQLNKIKHENIKTRDDHTLVVEAADLEWVERRRWAKHSTRDRFAFDPDSLLPSFSRFLASWAGQPTFYLSFHSESGAAKMGGRWVKGEHLAEAARRYPLFRRMYALHGAAINLVVFGCKAGKTSIWGNLAEIVADHLGDSRVTIFASEYVVGTNFSTLHVEARPPAVPFRQFGGQESVTAPVAATVKVLRSRWDAPMRPISTPWWVDTYCVDAIGQGSGVWVFVSDGEGGGAYELWDMTALADEVKRDENYRMTDTEGTSRPKAVYLMAPEASGTNRVRCARGGGSGRSGGAGGGQAGAGAAGHGGWAEGGGGRAVAGRRVGFSGRGAQRGFLARSS